MPAAWVLAVWVAIAANSGAYGQCKKLALEGEVQSGHEWNRAIGEGWILRLVPIVPTQAGYTGWDMAIDRIPAAGYPDAVLLATLPYSSVNEREVGTTYGLRAQDAIGWNPRSFRFLASKNAFLKGQRIFRQLESSGELARASRGDSHAPDSKALAALLQLEKNASAGEMRILDAGIAPGIADPAPFAATWAANAARTQHQVEPAANGQATPMGSVHWMRFSFTLWLPDGWKTPSGTPTAVSPCRK